MKSYHTNSGAGLAGLTMKVHDQPKAGAREALIRVRATSLNFRELSILRGNYPLPVKQDVVMAVLVQILKRVDNHWYDPTSY